MNKRKTITLITTIIYVGLIIAMAIGTVIEKGEGPAVAADKVYHSGWFITLWVLLLSIPPICMLISKKRKSKSMTILLTSMILILIGSIITFTFGSKHELQLMEGESYDKLPFVVHLDECNMAYHEESESAKNYYSILTISEPSGESHLMQISVNHIGKYRNYRFYQMGYDPSGGSSIIVTHDPWGMGLVYSGFALMLASFILTLCSRDGKYRHLLKKLSLLALLTLSGTTLLGKNIPNTLPRQQAKHMGEIMVSYHGRICPLQTLAYDVTNQLYGKSHYQHLTAEQVLSGWIFYPNEWMEVPIKGGKHLEDRRLLQQALLDGRLFRIFPITDSCDGVKWYSPADKIPSSIDEGEYLFVKYFLGYCQEQVILGETCQLDTLFDKMERFQKRSNLACNSSTIRVAAEKHWNKLSSIKPIAIGCTALGIILFIYFISCLCKKRSAKMSITAFTYALLSLLSTYLLTIMVLRWIAQQHIPLTNGYETMIFLGLTSSFAALLLGKRAPILLPGGLLMAGLFLLVSSMSGGDVVMSQIPPVLQSPLLCIHVSFIMLSYMLLSFVFMIGIGAVFCSTQIKERLKYISLVLLYPAILLLAAGIIIGSIWANISWGCYWSWDPKEVWALITGMIYLLPLHIKWLQKPSTYHIFCILAFLSVVITYFGVNLLLGGMHSYA